MSEKISFQYAILRYVHDVVTGEFLNTGLAMYSPSARYFKVRLLTRYKRLTETFPGADGEAYRGYIYHLQSAYERVAQEVSQAQMSFLDQPLEDIRNLINSVLPPDDSEIQFGEPRFGITDDLDGMFDYIYGRQIERYTTRAAEQRRTDDEVWSEFRKPLQEQRVLPYLREATVRAKRETFKFSHTWTNGHLNVLYPQSFDLIDSGYIRQKARTIIGTATILHEAEQRPHLFILLGKPGADKQDATKAYRDAKGMLEDQTDRLGLHIVEEDQAEEFARKIKPELEAHKG